MGRRGEPDERDRWGRGRHRDHGTAHTDFPVPEAQGRSKGTEHALHWVGAGRGEGRGGRDSTDVGKRCQAAPRSGGAGRLGSRGCAEAFLLQVCPLASGLRFISLLPTLQLARQGCGQKWKLLSGRKGPGGEEEGWAGNTSTSQTLHPTPAPGARPWGC